MIENRELKLAWDFISNTNRNVFLTGKAGTGKTTFLHKLKQQLQKRILVVAPTGVAAINAKGVTIHSFFQLPFGPILPNDNLISSPSNFNQKLNRSKINIIKSLDVLIIDEISMVRADLLDGIDKTLKRFKRKDLPFGGIQLVMIGDLQQLSPVVREHEWQLLQPFYKNAFFFSSIAYQNSSPITIELKQIYRQENPVFINILNEIRNNSLSQSSADELNKRYNPSFVLDKNEGYISLTTHNHKANQINIQELQKLKKQSRSYKATIKGKFPEQLYPNTQDLKLKVGAQVMFIKNDSSPEKRYFNGKVGKVIFLDDDEVVVNCPDDDFNIITKPEIWENIKYTIDEDTKTICEDKIGSFQQMPLRLAWSITIHKSQGLTFEKAIIDGESAFAHGQMYVALSRCKSLEGLVLKSKITPSQIITNSDVISFNLKAKENPPNLTILQQSKRAFQLDLISEIFNFYKFLYPVDRILDIYYKNKGSIEGQIEAPLTLMKSHIKNMLKVSTAFNKQLQLLCNESNIPESNTAVQDRFSKALSYYEAQIKTTIEAPLKTLTHTTDNKAIEKDINKHLDAIEELLAAKTSYVLGLKDGFNVQQFLELRAKAVFLAKEHPKKLRKMVVDGTTNVELFELLRRLRNKIAQREGLAHFKIFNQKSLYTMCESLPTTKEALERIHGMGKVRIDKYGLEIVQLIKNYCEENDVETLTNSLVIEKKKPRQQKGATKKISLELFKAGKSLEEIAEERDLRPNTIFEHLASFISSKEIKVMDLMSESHYKELKEIIPTKTFQNLSDLKHQLHEKYTYNELRLVVNELIENAGGV